MTQVIEPAFVAPPVVEENKEKKDEKEKEKVKIRFSVFFDGTRNNRSNTEQRELAQDKNALNDEKHRKAKEIYEKYKNVDSYENDYTNVAKMEKYVLENNEYNISMTRYIEGPGTEDNEKDSKLGYGMGVGGTGVRKKVKKGLMDVLSDITQKVKKDKIIENCVIDVFGFSRGAAGARNFIYESLLGDELDPLKKQLVDKGYEVKKVNICFAGLYDTVSSHGYFYCNDVSDLKLAAVRHAENVVHLVAADEHRENFSVTTITSSGFKGREIYLPGVHSDIGGSYREGAHEKHIIYEGNSFVAENDKNELIKTGWFKNNEMILDKINLGEEGELAVLGVDRKSLSNKYSRIPLHLMAKFSRENKINIDSELERTENIPSGLLSKAKERIDKYISETDPKNNPKQKSTASDWHRDDDQLLQDLRNKYFHFSAKWEFGLKPRMSFWSSTRYRKTYSG